MKDAQTELQRLSTMKSEIEKNYFKTSSLQQKPLAYRKRQTMVSKSDEEDFNEDEEENDNVSELEPTS